MMRLTAVRILGVVVGVTLLSGACTKSNEVTNATSNTDVAVRTKEFPTPKTKIDVVWQNTSVDIEPTSRYRDPEGGDDTASITTTLVLASAISKDAQDYLDGLTDVRVSLDGADQIIRLFYRERVPKTGSDPDTYTYHTDADLPFVNIVKDGDVSVTAMLPRSAIGYPGKVPTYGVALVSATEPDAQRSLKPTDQPSQRVVVTWWRHQDSPWDIVYQYVRRLTG